MIHVTGGRKIEDFQNRIQRSREEGWDLIKATHQAKNPGAIREPSLGKLFTEDYKMIVEYAQELGVEVDTMENGQAICALLGRVGLR